MRRLNRNNKCRGNVKCLLSFTSLTKTKSNRNHSSRVKSNGVKSVPIRNDERERYSIWLFRYGFGN